jgi:hypothetical protein
MLPDSEPGGDAASPALPVQNLRPKMERRSRAALLEDSPDILPRVHAHAAAARGRRTLVESSEEEEAGDGEVAGNTRATGARQPRAYRGADACVAQGEDIFAEDLGGEDEWVSVGRARGPAGGGSAKRRRTLVPRTAGCPPPR